MQRILSLAAIFIILAPALARGDDMHFPPRRPGLWENTMKSGIGKFESKSCTSRETDRALMEYGFAAMKKMGGKVTMSGGGNRFHVTTVMSMSGHVMTTNEDMVFSGDTAIQARGRTHIDPPFTQKGMPNDDVMQSDGKWVGPCPADMQPGDMITAGRKINVLKAEATRR